MKKKIINGIVPILITPFDKKGKIDVNSLQSLIDFNINSGVHGLGVANGSEVFKLNEEERKLVTKTVVDHVAGRVPVVINTGASGTLLATQYSKVAEEQGADALMIIPPHFMPVGINEIIDYYSTISSEVNIPIFLQDIPQAPISATLAVKLEKECKNISYIKVETLPTTDKIFEINKHTGNKFTIFGGAGGIYFIEEMRRGAKGTMPFCSLRKKFVEVWNLFQKGDEKLAQKSFDNFIAKVNKLEFQNSDLFYHFHKQFLVKLGVIESAYVRSPTMRIDSITQYEIEKIIEDLLIK